VLSTLALFGLALLLGATIYESVVMAPNYERDIPTSVELARQFLKRTTPAHFFRIITPLTQLLLLASLVASWQVPAAHWRLLAALGLLCSSTSSPLRFTIRAWRSCSRLRWRRTPHAWLAPRASGRWAT
jgi:hypothetical protein